MTTTTKNAPIFTCQACGVEVHGFVTVELEVDLGSGRDGVTATGKVTGLRVQHDCVPKVTRQSGLTPGGSCRD